MTNKKLVAPAAKQDYHRQQKNYHLLVLHTYLRFQFQFLALFHLHIQLALDDSFSADDDNKESQFNSNIIQFPQSNFNDGQNNDFDGNKFVA